MSYSSYFRIAHKNIYPATEASWNLVGSKTFGVYLAKWRHPSWKWPVRYSVATVGKCKLSNIYTRRSTRMICMAASGSLARGRRRFYFLLSNDKIGTNQIEYVLMSYSPYNVWLYFLLSRGIRESGNARLYHEIVSFEQTRGSLCASIDDRKNFHFIRSMYFSTK